MTILEAILLAIVQGMTEFLPVSSSAHLVLVQDWLGMQQNAPNILAFDVIAHVGTLLAVFVVFRKPFMRLMSLGPSSRRILGLAFVSTVVTGIIGVLCQDFFESLFTKLHWVGAALLVTGALLATTAFLPRQKIGWKRFTISSAIILGLAQAAAIIPGISRSGATISVALMLGIRRRWAAEFSFLIAAPAILGATLIKIKDLYEQDAMQSLSAEWTPLLIGGAVSAVVGYFALLILLGTLQHAKLHWFSYYTFALGSILIFTRL